MTHDTIDPQLRRALEDEQYEGSTVGADRWRERLAQRHRLGRALDLPPREDNLAPARALLWIGVAALALWTCAAGLIWALA